MRMAWDMLIKKFSGMRKQPHFGESERKNMKEVEKINSEIATWFDRAKPAWAAVKASRGEVSKHDFEKALYFNGIEFLDGLVAFTREVRGSTGPNITYMTVDQMVDELWLNMCELCGGAK
jgi:hypothetical protein